MCHKPPVNLIWRHVGRYLGCAPDPAHGGILGADPDLFAELHVAEIDVLIRQNHDHPLVDIDDDLLSGLDRGARPGLELAVVWLPPPGIRVARLDAHAKPSRG